MGKPFEFKVDEDAKPLTKKEAMEAERKLIQWIFSECEACLNSRPVVSENGIHHACCLSGMKAFRCMIGTKDQYIGLKERDVAAFRDINKAFSFGVTNWMPLPEPPKEE